MKKIISFSLFGTDPKYTNGAICNAELAKIIYPEWICRFYCGVSIPQNVIDNLKSYENVEVVIMDETQNYSFRMWRYLPIIDDNVSIFLSRDADSRLSYRERKVVDIFIESDTLIHSIQDHGCHFDFMAGMWGMKKSIPIDLEKLFEEWGEEKTHESDQLFLREIIVPLFGDKKLIHCSYYKNNFPFEKENHHFIGEIFPYDNYNKPYNYVFY
jgi:hypothetical protein